MPKLEFRQSDIEFYLKDKRKHIFYDATKAIAEDMAVHADGLKPVKLLQERRPNEPQEVLDYRLKIFSAITKPVFSKILSSLQKIRRSADWNIRYEGEYPKISDEETLESYCELEYPVHGSVTNWLFAIGLRKYLIDPNAVVLVMPEDFDVPENEYFKPVPFIFTSENVIDFKDGDFAVLLNPTGARYMSGNSEVIGKSFYFCTTNTILRYDQVNGRGGYEEVLRYNHNMGYLAAFKLKGVIVEEREGVYLYESRIDGILPELKEALREYSDLQAAKVLHIYPERWEYTQNECNTCKGSAVVPNPDWSPDCGCPNEIKCPAACENGYVIAGPYSKIMVRPVSTIQGTSQIPTPPAGYVEKDVEIVKVMDESIARHIYSALSAINFEFLARTPLSQSGVAKEVDKDELNNTVHSIAEDLVAILDNIYWITAYMRYNLLYPSVIIDDMVPAVSVPERYDLLTSQHTAEDLKNARESKLNPVIMSALEIDYASSRFSTEPEVRDMLVLVLTLDPLANMLEDDKNSQLMNKGITLETYIISCNIKSFIARAIDENESFPELPLDEQRAVLAAFAKEQITAQDLANQLSAEAAMADIPDEENQDADNIGKIPLAVQQLSLAAARAAEAGDVETAAAIKAKINQLLAQLADKAEDIVDAG